VVGDLFHAVVGHVGDHHAELGRRVHIDVVEADAVAGHGDAALGTFEHGRIDRAPAREDGVGRPGEARQLGVARGPSVDGFDPGRRQDRLLAVEVVPGDIGDQGGVSHGQAPGPLSGHRCGGRPPPDTLRLGEREVTVARRPGPQVIDQFHTH
jgi:hypothetical protein